MATPSQPKDPDNGFSLVSGEPLGEGLRRLLLQQLQIAIGLLAKPGDSFDEAIHEVRKCFKRSRSLLRLVRAVIGDAYRAEDRRLRAAGRSLSEVRDAQVLIETLAHLRRKLPATARKSKELL